MNGVVELLKALRERGLSQAEITRRTGVPQPRLSRWGSGDVPAAASDVLKLQQLLGELERPQGPPPAAVGPQQPQAVNA